MSKLSGKFVQLIILFSGLIGCKSVAPVSNGVGTVNGANRIITVTEVDPHGDRFIHNEKSKVIDPNSELRLELNEAAIFAANAITPLDDDFTERLTRLKNMLQQEDAAMKTLASAITSFERSGDWQKEMAQLSAFMWILDDPQLRIMFEAMEAPDDIFEEYANLFSVARTEVQALRKVLDEQARKEGLYIQLGMWIQSREGRRPVHVPGFDNLTDENYRVEQFQVVLTKEQKKQVHEIAAMAEAADRDGFLASLNARQAIEKAIARLLESGTMKKVAILQDTIDSYIRSTTVSLGNTRQALESLREGLEQYTVFVTAVTEKYRQQGTQDAATLLLETNADLGRIIDRTTALQSTLRSNTERIASNINDVEAETRNAVMSILAQAEDIGTTLVTELADFKAHITNAIKMVLSGERFQEEGVEFSEEVKRISFSDTPQQVTVYLENTGKRDIGDVLAIKLVSGKSDGSTQVLEQLRYHLYFCTPYVRTAVNFLFVDPVPVFEKAAERSLFQYAPSYSFLLKGFWKSPARARKSLAYHSLYSPGVGINVATVDFNSDGAPEIGIGAVFSLFNDFIQVGHGFDTVEGRGYSFFGLKIPVGSLTLNRD